MARKQRPQARPDLPTAAINPAPEMEVAPVAPPAPEAEPTPDTPPADPRETSRVEHPNGMVVVTY